MGSPLGPTLANAFLCHYEKEWLDSCPIEFRPKLYQRYIDDIFVMFWSRDHVKKFVDYMHTQHFNMRFTFKIEDQNSFSFLDIEIISKLRKELLKHQFIEKVHSMVFYQFQEFYPCYI